METRKHALLGASSSGRWLRCTPSAVAESKYPDKSSEFAEEGTLAHAIGAKRIKEALGQDTAAEEEEIRELFDRYQSGEMFEYAGAYAAFVLDHYRQARERAERMGEITPELRVEQHLDYSTWADGGFGTGDAVIVSDGEIEIIDLKYGKGVEVKAERNTQMMLYALGAIDFFDYAYNLRTVTMTIYQPRIGNISTWSMSVRELLLWADEELRPLARLAAGGRGVRASGPWCRFCKAKGDCPRLAAENLGLWQLNEDAEEISDDDLPEILGRLDTVADWVTAVKERALSRALNGESIRGWKLVAGRSVRKIADTDRAAELLRAQGVEEERIWKARELRTLTDMEKEFGKKQLGEWLGSVIVKPAGKPTLAPESDKRKALEAGDEFSAILGQTRGPKD